MSNVNAQGQSDDTVDLFDGVELQTPEEGGTAPQNAANIEGTLFRADVAELARWSQHDPDEIAARVSALCERHRGEEEYDVVARALPLLLEYGKALRARDERAAYAALDEMDDTLGSTDVKLIGALAGIKVDEARLQQGMKVRETLIPGVAATSVRYYFRDMLSVSGGNIPALMRAIRKLCELHQADPALQAVEAAMPSLFEIAEANRAGDFERVESFCISLGAELGPERMKLLNDVLPSSVDRLRGQAMLKLPIVFAKEKGQ